jgi:hypothetical protein
MDCCIFVLSTPVICMTMTIIGYTLGKLKNQKEVDHLTDYNEKLQDMLDYTQQDLEKSNARFATITELLNEKN